MAFAAAPGTTNPTSTNAQKVPPNQSLYFQNLPEKLQKDDLRRALYMLLSTYGPVLDVTALKTSKMRGQAHVLFKDVQSATQALRACQGFDFFGREMRISYSTNRSNTLAKLTGTFNQPITTADQQNQIAQAPGSFPAPPGTLGAPPSALPAPPGSLPAPPGALPAPPSGPPARPGGLPAPPGGLPPPPGLSMKVNGEAAGLKVPETEAEDVASPQGTKRPRDDKSDEEDVAMEEDDEEQSEMEMSEDEE